MFQKRVYNEVEAAEYLTLSRHTLRKQRSDGERDDHIPVIPYIRIGRSVRYLREELDAYIDLRVSESRSDALGVSI